MTTLTRQQVTALGAELPWLRLMTGDVLVWHAIIYTSTLQHHTACDELVSLKKAIVGLPNGRLCQRCLRALTERVRRQGVRHD